MDVELCMLLVDVRRPRVLLTHKAAEARGRWEGTHARTLEVVVVVAAAAAVVVVVVVMKPTEHFSVCGHCKFRLEEIICMLLLLWLLWLL